MVPAEFIGVVKSQKSVYLKVGPRGLCFVPNLQNPWRFKLMLQKSVYLNGGAQGVFHFVEAVSKSVLDPW